MEEELRSCPEPPRPETRIPVRIEEILAGVAIGLLALITFANVVVRYLTNFSFAFTEEFSVFLMIIMALIGSSSVMAKNGHLSINFFVDRARAGIRRWLKIGAGAAVVLLFLGLAWLGGRMAWDEYRYEVTSPGLGIPTWIYTIWLPLLSLAVAGRALGVVIRFRRQRA